MSGYIAPSCAYCGQPIDKPLHFCEGSEQEAFWRGLNHGETIAAAAARDAVLDDENADAVWEFALDFARTSGDSPECQCVSCRACRAVQCPGCDDPIPTRYRKFGVCGNCYNTTDDPRTPRRAAARDAAARDAVLDDLDAVISKCCFESMTVGGIRHEVVPVAALRALVERHRRQT